MSYDQFPAQSSSSSAFLMSISSIQGQVLEVTVVGCCNLKDTEWISRQDPYVCIDYANSKHRTRTHTDGGKNPTFQDKFVIPLIEGLREMNVKVWNRNIVTYDDFIGEGNVQLHKVLSQGYDDATWPLRTKTGRYGGAVRLIMHYSTPNISAKPNKPVVGGYVPSAPPYEALLATQAPMYSTPPLASAYEPPPQMYAPPPPAAAYPASAPSLYPSYPAPGGYPTSPYGVPSLATTYPPPPPSSTYPPPPEGGTYGMYPAPPY